MLFALVILVHISHAVATTPSNTTINTTKPVTPTSQSWSSNATESVTVSPTTNAVPVSYYVKKYGNLTYLTAKCNINILPVQWRLPENISSLDLSYNGLQKVPSGFFKKHNLSKILFMSLRGNNLTIIEEDAFMGLQNLEILDLSFVNLREWRGNIARSLRSLKFLDVTGNSGWLPSDNIFNIPSLHQIQGVTWSKACFNCTLFNHVYYKSIDLMPSWFYKSTQPTNSSIYPTQNYTRNSTSKYNEEVATRSETPVLRIQQVDTESNKMTNYFHDKKFSGRCNYVSPQDLMKCLPTGKKENRNKDAVGLPTRLFYIAYVLGAVGILLNFSIIFIYIYSTNIRKINSMLLISNMAFCDVLVGVYAIIIAENNIFNMLLKQDEGNGSMFARFCPVASVLFTVGQIVSVITALLLTIDKFLSIVYCMDPNRKLSRRLSLLVLLLCWVGVIVYAFAPQFSTLTYSPLLLCTFPTQEKSFIGIVCLLLALYLANIPLYAKIFLFVRRSSVRMGVRRDAALAKKIAVLILTNFVFFALPMISIIIFTFVLEIHYHFTIDKSTMSIVKYIFCYLFPIICLCLNSCLNPFLCAFRQRQFRREFKKCLRNCFLSRFCKAFSTFRTDSSSRNTQPTRVEMYKLSHIDSQIQGL